MSYTSTFLSVFASLAFMATSASATPTTLTANGQVTSITALQSGSSVAVPPGSINVGDSYTVSATFDLANAELTPLYDADPTINIYYLPGSSITYSIGSFSRTFIPQFDFNSSVQLWHNYLVGSNPEDSQTFQFFDYNVMPPSALPFNLGVGQQSSSLSLYAFNFNATARTNDLITQFAPFSAFSKTLSLGQLNSDSGLFVDVEGSVISESISAVPEPSKWVLMIMGFAVVGSVLRRKRQILRVVHASQFAV